MVEPSFILISFKVYYCSKFIQVVIEFFQTYFQKYKYSKLQQKILMMLIKFNKFFPNWVLSVIKMQRPTMETFTIWEKTSSLNRFWDPWESTTSTNLNWSSILQRSTVLLRQALHLQMVIHKQEGTSLRNLNIPVQEKWFTFCSVSWIQKASTSFYLKMFKN